MRLIDADALMEELLKWNTEAVRTGKHINTLFSSGMIGVVKISHTVDAVPVIRCRDCKYWRKTKKQCGYTYLLPQFEADEYCSRAERRNNGKTD